MRVCVCVCTQLCPTLCRPVDYSPPGSSVHRIFQARILEWVTISYSRSYLPNPGIELMSLESSALTSRFFTTAPSGKPSNQQVSLVDYLAVCTFQFHSLSLPPSMSLFSKSVRLFLFRKLSSFVSFFFFNSTYQFSLVTQSCLTACDPMDCNVPSFSVHHQLLDLAQTNVN